MWKKAKEEYSDSDKRRAAYALNMCTVSISQIIDYNDSYIMDQEYDAILNNLNLEAMPADDALLNILTEILNVITFFRVQDIKKDKIEKKYQQKVKNAIWSAVPNMNVLVAGNPVAIAASLAIQVGIGYMNYRKEKFNNALDKELEESELQISAIEQLNALKRELFTTAWRLANEYGFPDEWRLTEKQIKQYNHILSDQDDVRKFERLYAIKDSFEAYPPFWFQLGHTAAYLATGGKGMVDKEASAYYLQEAEEYFGKFYDIYRKDGLNLLREDKMVVSYALEYTDMLLKKIISGSNAEKAEELLDLAEKMSLTDFDALELCAFGFLKLGNYEKATKILRVLVNEEYNLSSNARLLSRLYVSRYMQYNDHRASQEYAVLEERLGIDMLFPMPNHGETEENLIAEYTVIQKNMLEADIREAYVILTKKYISKMNAILPYPGISKDDEGFLDNTPDARRNRQKLMNDILANEMSKAAYLRDLKGAYLRKGIIDIINGFLESLDELSVFKYAEGKDDLLLLVREKIVLSKKPLKKIQESIDNGSFTTDDYKELAKYTSFQYYFADFLNEFKKETSFYISGLEKTSDLERIEVELLDLCDREGIILPEYGTEDHENAHNNGYFDYELLGAAVRSEADRKAHEDRLIDIIASAEQDLFIKGRESQAKLLMKGTDAFDGYFVNAAFKDKSLSQKTIAIVYDLTGKSVDLLLFSNGMSAAVSGKDVTMLFSANDITCEHGMDGDKLRINKIYTYKHDSIDVGRLFVLLNELSK